MKTFLTSNAVNTDNSKAATQALPPQTSSPSKAHTRVTNIPKASSPTPANPATDQQIPVPSKRATAV